MDFLNKAFAQFSDLFRSMTPGMRIATGLLLVVTVASVGYLFNRQSADMDAYLMGGEPFPPSQIGAVQAALGKANLTCEIEGNRIRIPSGQEAKYMAALSEAGALPQNFSSFFEKAFADSSSPFLNKEIGERRYQFAKQQALADIISHWQGVESATVMYSEQSKPSFGQERLATATVSVKPIGSQSLPDEKVAQLRSLVAGGFAGLKAENVTVMDQNGLIFPSGADGGSGPMSNRYLAAKRSYEKNYEETIRKALSYVSGVVVACNVDVDTLEKSVETATTVDPKTVPVEQRDTSMTESTQAAIPSGRPGVGSNGANQPATVSAAGAGVSKKENTTNTTKNLVATSSKQMDTVGLTPKKVNVSVSVPMSYFEQVWRQSNPPAAGEETKSPPSAVLEQLQTKIRQDIENLVVNLVPQAPSGDTFPRVKVIAFQQIAPDKIVEPTVTHETLNWFDRHWSTVGMVFLAMFSLLMLRSMVRSSPAGVAAAPAEPLRVAATPDDNTQPATPPAEEVPRARLKRRNISGPNLRDELADIVREDPDAAANILRTWIGSPG